MTTRPPQHSGDALSGAPTSARQRAAVLAGVLALAMGGWFWAHRDIPYLLWSSDEYEYADIARRLAGGEGFTTGVVFPPHLEYGADRAHPSLVRPPLWPLEIAALFALVGPQLGAVHALAAFFFAGTALLAAALALELAGPLAGAVAGVAVATSPQIQTLALGGLSETSFAFWMTLAFLLVARRSPPLAIGAVCGLAYLTRYDGLALAAVVGAMLLIEQRRLRPAALYVLGFVVVATPWWLRNAVVAGNPLYALTGYNLFMAPFRRGLQTSLIYQIEPDLSSSAAVDPLEKARLQLPLLLRFWPPASANLAACLGVVLGALRRERLALGLVALALVTTLGLAFAMTLGRYFIALMPALLACGAAAWLRFGGRLAPLGLALLLAAPLLPSLTEAPDLALLRRGFDEMRAGTRDPAAWVVKSERAARCLSRETLFVGHHVAPLVWSSAGVGIYMPAGREDFWRVIDTLPVQFVQLRDRRRVGRRRFDAHFAPRPDCGESFYERRDAAR